MNLKVGDSVLYLSQKQQHTGIITAIDKDNKDWLYSVHWINDQDTNEPKDAIMEYRQNYLEALNK